MFSPCHPNIHFMLKSRKKTKVAGDKTRCQNGTKVNIIFRPKNKKIISGLILTTVLMTDALKPFTTKQILEIAGLLAWISSTTWFGGGCQ